MATYSGILYVTKPRSSSDFQGCNITSNLTHALQVGGSDFKPDKTLLISILYVMFNKRVGVFYHNIKHDAYSGVFYM